MKWFVSVFLISLIPILFIFSSCLNSTLLLTQLSSNLSKSVFRTNPFVNVQLLLNICSLTFSLPKLSAPQPLACLIFNLCGFFFFFGCCLFVLFSCSLPLLKQAPQTFLTLRIFTPKKEKLISNVGCCHRGLRKWNACFTYLLMQQTFAEHQLYAQH